MIAPAHAKQTIARHATPSMTLEEHVQNGATNAMLMRTHQTAPATSPECNISV
jgi:hypothetical protein